jgi:hypothetical protein
MARLIGTMAGWRKRAGLSLPGLCVRLYSPQPSMMRKLAKHPHAKLPKRHEDESGRVTGEEWEIPKALVSIRSGSRRRVLSLAQKARAREALRRARKTRQAVAAR